MPGRCVVGGCNNTACLEKGIGLHTIPFFEDSRPEAKKRRKRWVDFVKSKRARWEPSKSSVVCSAHFLPSDFERRFSSLPGQTLQYPRLIKDDLGFSVYPTVHAGSPMSMQTPQTLTERDKRKMIREAMERSQASSTSASTASTSTIHVASTHVAEIEPDIQLESVELPDSAGPAEFTESLAEDEALEPSQPVNLPPLGTGLGCTINCQEVKNRNRQLRNRVKSLRSQLAGKKKAIKRCRRRVTKLEQQIKLANKKTVPKDLHADHADNENSEHDFSGNESDREGDIYETETETEGTTETEEEEDNGNPEQLTVTGTNLRTEPKHIVFLSQLLLLFNFCHVCKTENPSVEARQVGTEAVVTTSCNNPKCPKQVNTWHSQPTMPGSGIPAANFLLCMAILLAGGSATKVFQIFAHMGLGCVSLNTYFKYQRSKLFPTIHVYWKKYQATLLEKVKAVSGGVVVAGDG